MSAALPPLACPTCGACEVPRISPGTGPHTARLDCAACGRFVKWAPKVLVHPCHTEKETQMVASVNRVVLLGTIGTYGVTVTYVPSGTPCATFTLVVSEQGQDGKEHATFVDCEIWGRKAEAAGELEPGQLALFEGKLRKRQKGEGQWELVVSGVEVCPIRSSAEVLT